MNWRPTADIALLRQRAALLAQVRAFFSQRDVLEVETPLLCQSGVSDPNLESFTVDRAASLSAPRFLQTSPEYAMKRLLAAYGEPVFQVTRAFRDGEAGSRHNPEFSLLEWYRPGFDYQRLMDEVQELVAQCLGELTFHRYPYRELFQARLDVDPMLADSGSLEALARAHVDCGATSADRDAWLDLLMSHVIAPQLAREGACFVYDYPASQASLSRVVEVDGVPVAQRFELYVHGLELANGFFELADAGEQRRRFERDNAQRRRRGQAELAADERLLAALQHGLPDCSGVALGLDRLLMLLADCPDIRAVLAFDWSAA